MLWNVVLLIVGLVIIVKSADALVSSSASLAKKLKIPAFIVGIVIVAFGTSAPELIIGIMSGITNTNELTLGNIIGSGFSNIAFILGVSAIIMALKTEASVVKLEIPILIGTELLLFGLLFFDNELSRVDGIILVACFVLFMVYIMLKTKFEQKIQAKKLKPLLSGAGNGGGEQAIENPSIAAESAGEATATNVQAGIDQANQEKAAPEQSKDDSGQEQEEKWFKIIITLVLSLAGLLVGGKMAVDYSEVIALALGLNETFIGITIVAIATTLPELMASIAAVRQKEVGIVLGNCIGSNIFNILLVLGGSAIINPINYDSALTIDFCLLIALTVAVFLVSLIRKKISRIMGIILVSCYILYLTYKVLSITVLSGLF